MKIHEGAVLQALLWFLLSCHIFADADANADGSDCAGPVDRNVSA